MPMPMLKPEHACGGVARSRGRGVTLETGHEAAALRDGDPMADEGVHGGPGQTLEKRGKSRRDVCFYRTACTSVTQRNRANDNLN
jgi:hypothetical protein